MNDIPQSEKTRWREETMVCVQVTELFDEQWRNKNPNHNCRTKIIYENGNWYCQCMVRARKKDKGLREMWKNNFQRKPYKTPFDRLGGQLR